MGFRNGVSYRMRPGVEHSCCEDVGVNRGRGRHHNRQLAGLRRQGDAGNGQRGSMVQRYFENGACAGKGWGRCGRGVAYWPGKKARMGLVVWWVMEDVG